MKFFVAFAALLAVAAAAPSALLAPTFYNAPLIAPVATVPVASQYHAQDELGQYSYGYSGGPSAKTETKTIDGITRGAYSYYDPEGKLQSVEYTADALNGFRAAATNLPVAPIDDKIAPEPVKETPEVAKARAEHMVAFEEAKIRAAEPAPLPIAAPIAPIVAAAPLAKIAAPIAAPIATPFAAPIASPYFFRASETIAPKAIAYSYGYPYDFAYNTYPYGYSAPFFRSAIAPLPLAPQFPLDTPEVAKAKVEHFAAVAEAKARV